MHSSKLRCPRHRRAVITVEFAIVLPLALMFALAMIEFGQVNLIRNTVQNSAFAGARAAILPRGNQQAARESAQRLLNTCGVHSANITVEPATITTETETVRVTVSVPLQSNLLLASRFVNGTVIQRSCQLTREPSRSGY